MRTNIFVLGAGASVESGCPLSVNFLEIAEDLFDRGVIERADAFKRVFEFVHAIDPLSLYSDLDIFNLEHLFTFVEFCYRLEHVDWFIKGGNHITLRQDLVLLILESIQKTSEFQFGGSSNKEPNGSIDFSGGDGISVTMQTKAYNFQPHKSYEALIAAIRELQSRDEEVVIISFNYDINAEIALNAAGIPFHYCLEGTSTLHDKHHASVPVVKMHGSVNWLKMTTPKPVIEYLDIPKFLNKPHFVTRCVSNHYSGSVYLNVDRAMHLEFPRLDDASAENCEFPLLIPPVYDKMQNYAVFRGIWKSALEFMSRANTIYILGYSMPDTDILFKHIFSIAGHKNMSVKKEVVVVDPSDQTFERYKTFLKRGRAFLHRQSAFSKMEALPAQRR